MLEGVCQEHHTHRHTRGGVHEQTAPLNVALREGEGATSGELHHHLPMTSCSIPVPSPGTSVHSDTKKLGFILAAKLPSKEKTSQDNRFLWGRTQKGGQVVSHRKASPVTFSPGSRPPGQAWRGRHKLAPETFFFGMQMYLLSCLGILL